MPHESCKNANCTHMPMRPFYDSPTLSKHACTHAAVKAGHASCMAPRGTAPGLYPVPRTTLARAPQGGTSSGLYPVPCTALMRCVAPWGEKAGPVPCTLAQGGLVGPVPCALYPRLGEPRRVRARAERVEAAPAHVVHLRMCMCTRHMCICTYHACAMYISCMDHVLRACAT